MKSLLLFLIVFLLTLPFISCNSTQRGTSSDATLDYQIYFSVPNFNFFVTPEIKNQRKYDKISYGKDWFLTYEADWIEVSPKEGAANQVVLITITTRNEPKTAGQYQTEIRVETRDHTSYKTIPVTLNIIKEKQGYIYDIPADFVLNDIFSGATEYRNTTVELGRLKTGETSNNLAIYDAGDPCIVVSLECTNNTDNDTQLFLSGEGYDKNDTQMSWCISSGRLIGMDNFDLPAHQSTAVSLLFSWTNELSQIKLQGTVYTQKMLEPTPATPLPESELTHVWFDEEWFTANDRDPDPEYVRITFPTSWLERGRSDSFNGTGIEQLRVPKQLLIDDNESTNPDEITVYFPMAYFIGRPGAPAASITPD